MALQWLLLFSTLFLVALGQDNSGTTAEPETTTEEILEDGQPGFEIKVTQRGFNYAARIAIDTLMLKLMNLTIPDMREEIGPAAVGIHSVQVTDFPRPKSSLRILPGAGLRWKAAKLNPTISANYEAVMSLGFWDVEKSGLMIVEGKDLQFALDFNVGRDREGRPTVNVFECEADGGITIKFQGGWSNALNLGSRMFKRKIRSIILDQVCAIAKSEINEKAGWALANLNLVQDIPPDFEMDFSLVKYPAFKNHSAHAYHKGAFSYKLNMQEPPMEPAEIPFYPKHRRKMVYVYITSYMLNRALYVLHSNAFLAANVSSRQVPQNMKEYLAPRCERKKICLGSLIPDLAEHFPESEVLIKVVATEAPRLTVDSGNIQLSGAGQADVFAYQDETPVKILSVHMNITGAVRVVVRNGTVMFTVPILRSGATVEYSKMGTTNSELFQQVVNTASNKFLLPFVKELGRTGFILPQLDVVKLVQPVVINVDGLKDVMVIASDFDIKPVLSEMNNL